MMLKTSGVHVSTFPFRQWPMEHARFINQLTAWAEPIVKLDVLWM